MRRLLGALALALALPTTHDFVVCACRYLTAERHGTVPDLAAILRPERTR